DSHAVDHARSSRYQATTSGSDSAKRRFASQPSILRAFVESRYWTGISPTASFRMIGSTFPPTAAVTRSTTSRAVRRSPELKLKASPGAAPSAVRLVARRDRDDGRVVQPAARLEERPGASDVGFERAGGVPTRGPDKRLGAEVEDVARPCGRDRGPNARRLLERAGMHLNAT